MMSTPAFSHSWSASSHIGDTLRGCTRLNQVEAIAEKDGIRLNLPIGPTTPRG